MVEDYYASYDQAMESQLSVFDRRLMDLEAAVERQDRDHSKAILWLTIAWAAAMLVMIGAVLILEDRLGVLRSEMIGLLS